MLHRDSDATSEGAAPRKAVKREAGSKPALYPQL
jgi:hypothetical protein